LEGQGKRAVRRITGRPSGALLQILSINLLSKVDRAKNIFPSRKSCGSDYRETGPRGVLVRTCADEATLYTIIHSCGMLLYVIRYYSVFSCGRLYMSIAILCMCHIFIAKMFLLARWR